MRRLWVRTRWALRACRRWITGRSAMAPQIVSKKLLVEGMMRRFRTQWTARLARRTNNRDLLTGMTVALLHGPNIAPWSSWEFYKAHLGRKRSNYKPKRDVARLVGKPLVTKYPPNDTKVGTTEWWQEYVPRQEQLAAKKAAKRAARELRMAA